MGMPNLPPEIKTCIKIDHDGLVKLLLMSIALEEISLSHVLNAEGEIMQSYLKELNCKPVKNYKDFIKFNRNVSELLRIILEKEKTLKDKLYQVVQFDEDYCDKIEEAIERINPPKNCQRKYPYNPNKNDDFRNCM